jgi:hypothetical protein
VRFQLGAGHGAVALGQAVTGRVEGQRDVRVRRRLPAQQRREVRLARSRGEQVVATHDLVNALVGVVDDDREVVRRDAVVALEHDVVDGAGVDAVQGIRDRPLVDVGP